MSRSDDIWSVPTQRLNIGLSTIVGVTAGVGVATINIKLFAGGTLEILGASTDTWGSGYVFDLKEAITFGGPAEFYLAASGATCTAHIIRGKTVGT